MRTKPLSVLVIDDEPNVARVIAMVLTKAGCQTVCVNDAPQGLALAGTMLPDLILCDGAMRGLTGPELVAKLRERDLTAQIPVVLISGNPLSYFENQSIGLGPETGYLQKPFTARQLLDAVAPYMDSAAAPT